MLKKTEIQTFIHVSISIAHYEKKTSKKNKIHGRLLLIKNKTEQQLSSAEHQEDWVTRFLNRDTQICSQSLAPSFCFKKNSLKARSGAVLQSIAERRRWAGGLYSVSGLNVWPLKSLSLLTHTKKDQETTNKSP